MNDFDKETVYELATRLNRIMVETNELELKLLVLDKEYNDVVHKLWEQIPSLKNSVDIQPKPMRKVKERKK